MRQVVLRTTVTIVAIGLFTSLSLLAPIAVAYSLPGYSIGSSRIVQDFKIYIDGEEIVNPHTRLTLTTNQPILFGYTLDNVRVNITVVSDSNSASSTQTVASNNEGYWIYREDSELAQGSYTILMSMSDLTGTSTTVTKVGSFEIPEVLPEIIHTAADQRSLIPNPSLNSINYLTISLAVVGAMLLATLIYLVARIAHSIKDDE